MKKIYIFGAIIFSIILVATFYFTMSNKVNSILLDEEKTIELGENPFEMKLENVFKDYDILLKDKKIGKVVLFLEDKNNKKIKEEDVSKEKYLAVGTYKMKYVVDMKDNQEKEFLVTYKIEDTTKPKFIDFKDVVEIEKNEFLDLPALFKATDLSEVTIVVETDWKNEKFDPNVEGEYKMITIATDKYKNKTTKKFIVKIVAKKEVAENSNTENSTGNSSNTGGPPATGDNSSTGDSSNNGVTPPSNVCVPNGQFGRIGNSKEIFYSIAEADAYASNYIINQGENWIYDGYTAWTVYDNCGERNDVWTVNFY